MGYRVGVDVGGTFTDLICVTPRGDVVIDKAPTTPDDQSVGVMNALAQLAERLERGDGRQHGQRMLPDEPRSSTKGVVSTCSRVGLLRDENLEWKLRQSASGHDQQMLILDHVLNLTEQRFI